MNRPAVSETMASGPQRSRGRCDTLTNTDEQRYLLGVETAPEDPDENRRDDAALSHLYDLAEQIASEIALPMPDWCAIARDAAELCDQANKQCP